MQDDKSQSWFNRHGVAPPSSIPHGVSLDDVASKLRPLKAKAWKLEGNRLIADTHMGQVINYIDPGVIMTGVDSDNLPIFKRI
jgi:hypothetical protein